MEEEHVLYKRKTNCLTSRLGESLECTEDIVRIECGRKNAAKSEQETYNKIVS